jgi:hypothetical protein
VTGHKYRSARKMIHSKFVLKETIIETYTAAKYINAGKIPDAVRAPTFLPAPIILNLDAPFKLFTNYENLMDS